MNIVPNFIRYGRRNRMRFHEINLFYNFEKLKMVSRARRKSFSYGLLHMLHSCILGLCIAWIIVSFSPPQRLFWIVEDFMSSNNLGDKTLKFSGVSTFASGTSPTNPNFHNGKICKSEKCWAKHNKHCKTMVLGNWSNWNFCEENITTQFLTYYNIVFNAVFNITGTWWGCMRQYMEPGVIHKAIHAHRPFDVEFISRLTSVVH